MWSGYPAPTGSAASPFMGVAGQKIFSFKASFLLLGSSTCWNRQCRMHSFELAFYDAGMTKGTDHALNCSAMLVAQLAPILQSTRSNHMGWCSTTMHDLRPSTLLSLQRGTCSSACPPGTSWALALHTLNLPSRICTGVHQEPVGGV